MLARYTCVTLQRLNGSAKKVKGMFGAPSAGYVKLTISSGSLLNKTLRMEMNNAIFRKLQEAVEHPCRSKDWFGMAEQAINTIYALGEHPDELCSKIIKNLTRRAFPRRTQEPALGQEQGSQEQGDAMQQDIEPTSFSGNASHAPISQPSSSQGLSEQCGGQDTGDVLQLSQLLFVVGHVAIKHIVFLELVEREWKRQKDEKDLGNVHLSFF